MWLNLGRGIIKFLINYNMRCIEIKSDGMDGYAGDKINYNMRCIEI